MEKRRIVRRAAKVGLLILVVASVVATVTEIHDRSLRRRWHARNDARIEKARKEYQVYLDETARRLGGLPADPQVVGEIQARHFQGVPDVWMYVWATTGEGELSFGVPADAFTRLNAFFERHREAIGRDNHYADRDRFLRTLLHHSRRLSLEAPKEGDNGGRAWEDDWWRFHDEHNSSHDHDGGRRLFLSSPIQDAGGKTVGNLNLKLVDLWDDGSLRASPMWSHAEHISFVLIPFSLLWLWFLLPTWVFIDARERDVPRPILWAILVLVGNVFALLVYLISRPAHTADLQCPKCTKPLNGSKAGCPYCGADLSSAFCAQCQYPLKTDWTFCPACRTPITPPSPASSMEAK